MSRAASRHIAQLEDAIRRALYNLEKVTAHEGVYETGNPNCQCGTCRALRVLRGAKLRTADSH